MSKTLEIVLTVPEGTPIGLSRRGGSCEVAGVLPGSHAELAGLEPEDRILEVQGAVYSLGAACRAIPAGLPVPWL